MNLRPIRGTSAARPRRRAIRWHAVAGLALSSLILSSCEGSPLEVVERDITLSRAISDRSSSVRDLGVAGTTTTTMTVTWTQVDDGTNEPADYRVKYAVSPLTDWRHATTACTIEGTEIGAEASCTLEGLTPATVYDVQLMSYGLAGRSWKDAQYSNVATAETGKDASTSASGVVDLAVTGATEATVSLQWTQVDDGTGQPADYSVKYAASPLTDWSSSTNGCDVTGTEIGAAISCTVEGLSSGSLYDFQLVSYRTVDGALQDARFSNVATGETAVGSGGGAGASGIWVDRAALPERAITGADWDRLLADAGRDWGVADIENQDSNHDVYTLAGALVCVRTGQYCDKARQGVLDAIGTESGARWLAVGRNLGSYVIAADLLELRADGVAGSAGTRVQEWMEGWLTKQLRDNNTTTLRPAIPFSSGANAAAQEGFAYAAVAAYLGDDWALQRAWDAFRTYACDPTAPDRENIDLDKVVADGWAADEGRPCAVNPAGTSKQVPSGSPGAGSTHRIDGSLGGDMRRGGVYQWEPGYTSYPWVGLEGFIPAAVILQRAGYPAFDVADRAVLRTHEYLKELADQTAETSWFDGVRAREIVHLVNVQYGVSFPINRVVGGGRTVGYTGWTHPR